MHNFNHSQLQHLNIKLLIIVIEKYIYSLFGLLSATIHRCILEFIYKLSFAYVAFRLLYGTLDLIKLKFKLILKFI